MAEKDLRRKNQLVETSFIEGQLHDQEYQVIENPEVEQLGSDGGALPSVPGTALLSELSGHQRGLKPATGIIMRIGRGVKSAVGGAVHMIMQSGIKKKHSSLAWSDSTLKSLAMRD